VAAVRDSLPERCVVDGELVIVGPSGLDFDALQNRLHPAASRVNMLAGKTPASLVAFDLLALGDEDFRALRFAERRGHLVSVLAGAQPPVHVTPATTSHAEAMDWFERFEGAGLDGVVAKGLDLRYREGERAMIKVKHERTADAVVAGFRWHKSGGVVGSLMLGLWRDGRLQHIGVASAFSAKRRVELLEELAPYREDAWAGHPWGEWHDAAAHQSQRMPGSLSRWSATKDLSFEPLRAELVAEVGFNQLQGDRLRHPAQFRRWRPDRDPRSCTYEQLDLAVPSELDEVFGAGGVSPSV
jgi:ATP-dependent DNA ligase